MNNEAREKKINELATNKTLDELERMAGELHSTSILYAMNPDIYVQACMGYGMVNSAIKLKKSMTEKDSSTKDSSAKEPNK